MSYSSVKSDFFLPFAAAVIIADFCSSVRSLCFLTGGGTFLDQTRQRKQDAVVLGVHTLGGRKKRKKKTRRDVPAVPVVEITRMIIMMMILLPFPLQRVIDGKSKCGVSSPKNY